MDDVMTDEEAIEILQEMVESDSLTSEQVEAISEAISALDYRASL